MTECIAAENVRAGIRYAVVCPSVTGRIKDTIAPSKRAHVGSLAIDNYPQVARTCILWPFCFPDDILFFFWRHVFFVMCFRFCIFAFIESEALRSVESFND